MDIRVGMGFDVHQLAIGRDFWLGGVKIYENYGPLGHSDADVLLHALCDAILGAAGLRDIGYHFPPTDDTFKDADSKELLKVVMKLLDEKGYRISNADCTVVLEHPKVNPHIEAMQKALSPILKIDADRISVKATTNEKLGYIGREEGVAAYATVLIIKE